MELARRAGRQIGPFYPLRNFGIHPTRGRAARGGTWAALYLKRSVPWYAANRPGRLATTKSEPRGMVSGIIPSLSKG